MRLKHISSTSSDEEPNTIGLVADIVLPTQSINCLLSSALCAKNDYGICVGHVVAHAQNYHNIN